MTLIYSLKQRTATLADSSAGKNLFRNFQLNLPESVESASFLSILTLFFHFIRSLPREQVTFILFAWKTHSHKEKKQPRKINHKNLWTIFSATHSAIFFQLFVLYSRITDFWYLAFASLHLTQMACDAYDFFIDEKLIFKCITLGPFDEIKCGADIQKWNSSCLFKLTDFFSSLSLVFTCKFPTQ